MTVEKLIEKLQSYNPKATVKMHHKDGEPVLCTASLLGCDDFVWLECESDNDKEEIEAKFEAASYWASELDFYMDLLETGIDVEMVRKYMGTEIVEHMQKYCEEHGLI